MTRARAGVPDSGLGELVATEAYPDADSGTTPRSSLAFLKAFYPEGSWVITAIHPDRKGIEAKSFEPDQEAAAVEYISTRNGQRNLYFSVNPIKPGVPKSKYEEKDVECVAWLHVDIDARVREDLGSEIARIRAKIEKQTKVPRPTAVVFSGGGYQAFWKLKEPIPLPNREAIEAAKRYNKQLEIVFEGDNCHNIDRVMRLPDTMNLPNAKKVEKGRVPVLAEVHWFETGNVYDISEFTAAPETQTIGGDYTAAGTIPIPTNVPRVSIKDLDKWDVSDRVKVIIVQGKHPDDVKERDNSRSAWLFDAVCNLVRCDVPDEVIFSIITDPDFGISASVLDNEPREREYAARQIERAKEQVRHAPLVLYPRAPRISAIRFVQRRHSTLMHYNGEWLSFDGVAYVDLEDETIRSQLYEFMAAAFEQSGDDDDPSKLVPFEPNKAKVTNVVDALESYVHRPRDRWAPPCWLERDGPPPMELLACRNGLLHLPTGELHPSTSDFFTRNALEFAYDADAGSPERWLRFLNELWPEEDTRGTLQEIFGYLLTPDTSQQKIFLLVGPPRSGKGTIARVLQGLVGQRNVCAPTLKMVDGDFGLQAMIGKQLALVSDLRLGQKTDQAALAENLLRISGEDTVSANRKHKSFWVGRLAVRFLIMTNELPRFTDASGALANRFVPLVMRESFLGRENTCLLDEITPELPGILNWSIEGWRRLRARGRFVLPRASRDAIDALTDLASPHAAFIRDRCVFEPDAEIPKLALFDRWRMWCRANGDVHVGTLAIFGTRFLAAAGGRVESSKPTKGGRRVPHYRGNSSRRW